MAYTAELQIAVKGAKELRDFQTQLSQSSEAVDRLNRDITTLSGGGIPRSIANLSSQLAEVAESFNRVALGTPEAVTAARNYVRANDEINSSLRERLQLVRQIEAEETAAKRVVRPGDAGYGQQMPALPPAFVKAQEIQQSWKTFFSEAAEVGKDLTARALNTQQTWNTFFTEAADYSKDLVARALNTRQTWSVFFTEAAEYSRDLVAKALNTRQTWNTFFTEAAEYSRDLVAKAVNTRQTWITFFAEAAEAAADLKAKSLNTRTSWNKFFADAAQLRSDIAGQGAQARATRRGERLQGLALGAGFPLLFGGGPGAVLGGAAGGLVPGKGAFAAQIALSAIGQQLDKFVAEAAKAGVALTSTGKTFEYMRERALFSSTAVEDQAISLEEQGKVSELANLLTQDLAKSIGGEGVKALQALGDETNELTKQWNILTNQLFALVAGPLKDFIAALNSVLGGITTERRLAVLRAEATPAQQKRLAEITKQVVGGEVRNVRGGKTAFVAGPEGTPQRQKILELAAAEGIVPAAPAGRVTSQDLRTITAPRAKRDRGAAAAEREAERVAKVVREQQLLTLERQRQFEYAEKIFAAEMANDPITARRLQGEQQLTEWALETSKAVKSEQNTNAQLEIVKARIAEKNLIIQKTEQDIAEIAKRQKEQVDKTIAGLENELLIRNATTEAERESLRIAYEMAELRKQGGISEVDLARIQQLKTQLATPLSGGELVRQQIGLASDELAQLTDAGYQAVQAANAIGTAFGESFKGIISGSMTAQQALANFFQSVADHFIDMAAQMIAKWTVLALLNQIVKIFPGGGGGSIPLPGAAPQMTPGAIVTPEGFSGQFANLAANGAYFNNGIAKFARGGIVNSPTLFPFANGGAMRTGLMGEAGPEAIMPLRRGADGRLGVEAVGGGGDVTVVVNVDAKGSNVQGDDSQAKALGSAISVAVQAEIVKQQRPGGLLAGTR